MGDEAMVDWHAWHEKYDAPDSPLSRRLVVVQRLIGQWFERSAPRPVKIASVCAGDGRDLLEVLAMRTDAHRADLTLLENDPRLCARARDLAADVPLARIDVRNVDASVSDAYADIGPVDLLLLVGLFGNIADDEIRAIVDMLPAICAPGALVIWTRRPKDDLLPLIGDWFADRAFVEVFATPGQRRFHVAAHRFVGEPKPLRLGEKLFSFVF